MCLTDEVAPSSGPPSGTVLLAAVWPSACAANCTCGLIAATPGIVALRVAFGVSVRLRRDCCDDVSQPGHVTRLGVTSAGVSAWTETARCS